jgi:predicted dehydrogenase
MSEHPLMINMRILVIGLGSMGKRRIRNLKRLGYSNIIGFDSREDRRIETSRKYGIKTFSNLEEVLKKKPDMMIISTPPNHHLKYANIAIKKKINFFTELNLIPQDVEKISHGLRGKKIVGSPSSTMHYHPIIKALKKILGKNLIGKIFSIQHHSGQFLPNWHPWEDYRNFFVSKKETGGAKEIATIELTWLTHVFSNIKSVYGKVDKLSKLDADIDDIYHAFIEFKNKISCTLLVDVVSIPSFRETKIIGEKGTILCDFNLGIIKVFRNNKWKKIQVKMDKVAKGYRGNTPPEKLYEDEIKNYIDIISSHKKIQYTFSDELNVLKIVKAIEDSSKKGKKIVFNNME